MPPEELTPFVPSFPPLSAFGGAPLYVTGEDALCCTVFNAAAGVTVTITGRMLEFGATRPTPFTQTLIPATDRSASVVRFTLGDGWLLNAQAIVSAGTPATGQTFARLSLCRGITTNAIDLFTLAADYITAKLPLSYPGSGVLRSNDGAGALRSITGATPAVGAEVSETVPTGARWELLSLQATLTASAAVATRRPQLVLSDGVNIFGTFTTGDSVAASGARNYVWAQGVQPPVTGATSYTQAPVPTNVRLGAGYKIATLTQAIDVGDQWSNVRYLVREWIEGA